MDPKKATKITVEYEDGTKDVIGGKNAVLMQARINSAGVMAGIEAETEESNVEEKGNN